MKRLLIAIGNLNIGGGQTVVRKLVENIDRTQYEVKVLCCGPQRGTVTEKKVSEVCEVEYLGMNGTNVFGLVRAFRSISSYAPDVIHAHLGGVNVALPWCLLHKKRLVITAHTKPEKAFTPKMEKLVRSGVKKGLVYLIAVSEANFAACKAYFGLGDDRCFCVNNGVDVGRTTPSAHEGFTYINVATHNKNKNQEAILRCFARLASEQPDVTLTLAGDGPEHGYLAELAKTLGVSDRVAFPGMVDEPEGLYRTSDVYVQASHREAMPMSVLEAMGIGLPVIATDVGGLKDVVRDNGILVPDGDEDALYGAMRTLYHSTGEEKARRSSRSLEIVKAYSAEKMAAEHIAVYQTVCN